MTNGCSGCRNSQDLDIDFTMAFQPIVDIGRQSIFAHEALIRGLNGQGAGAILSAIQTPDLYAFDQACRVKAIELAASLGLAGTDALLSINFLPNAVYEPRACIRKTIETAMRTNFPADRIIFEFTETEKLDAKHVLNILRTYRSMGFRTAIDDFGSGHAGFALLAEFQPDIVKLDMALIRDIDTNPVKRCIVRNILAMLRDLGIEPLCEGVETHGELQALRDLGVTLVQGYVFSKPLTAALATSESLAGTLRSLAA